MNIIKATVERLLSRTVERVLAPDRLAEAFEYGRIHGRRQVIAEMAAAADAAKAPN